MGDRVLMQCHVGGTDHVGPVVYGHWLGSEVPKIVSALQARMAARGNDVDYASARLVQEAIAAQSHDCLGVGIWNTTRLLTEDDSHGDAGVVLIDVRDWTVQYFGGYYRADGTFKTFEAENVGA